MAKVVDIITQINARDSLRMVSLFLRDMVVVVESWEMVESLQHVGRVGRVV